MLVVAKNLSKTYRRGGVFSRASSIHAIDDLSFSLAPGKSLGVVGESGSGKSTLLRMILRLTPYDSGSLTFDGTEIASMDRTAMRGFRRRVQPVFQDPYSTFNPRFSIGSSIALGLKTEDAGNTGQRAQAIERLLSDVGLDPELRRAYPHELSGGQRQRAAVARAMAVRPELLLLDEPTSALDVSVQAQVLNMFKDLQRQYGFSIILVTHDLPVVTFICEDVLVMKSGAIVESGKTADIIERPQTDYARLLVESVPEPPAPNPNRT